MTSPVYRGRAYDPSKLREAHKQTLERVSGFTYRGKSYHYEPKHLDSYLDNRNHEDTELSV